MLTIPIKRLRGKQIAAVTAIARNAKRYSTKLDRYEYFEIWALAI